MKRLGCREIAAGNWLALNQISYMDNKGIERIWESVSRKKAAGAVAIICTLVPSGRLVLVRQYRPPADNMVIEFPAGLVNPGETPEETAVRELREETGYKGRLIRLIPDTFSSPGLSSEIVRLAVMEADENSQGELITDFDETEDIETILVDRGDLADFLIRSSRNGDQIDGRVSAFAVGMNLNAYSSVSVH
ncbi:MAG: NUDIX hydrolase [Lentisphaeria bacterium]|nr:NUDIX hydrolase [Lentisphaeria bacterium]